MSWMRALCVIVAAISFTLPIGVRAAEEGKARPPRVMIPCESATEISNTVAEKTIKKAGEASLLLDLSKSTNFSVANPAPDWSTHNAIRLWVHNEKAGPYYVYFLFFSENKASEGPDYYSARINLNFTGWRDFVFRRDAMGAARQPLGWDKISGVSFSTSWGEQEIDKTMKFYVDDICLEDREMTKGPRLTDAELFDAFDLTRPGLEKTVAAVQAKDYKTASHELAEYIRNRTTKTWLFDAHKIDRETKFNKDVADKAIAGSVHVCGVPHAFPNEKINWAFNATDKRTDMAYNPEWQWQLGRMAFWNDMGNAYWATGDEKYAKAWVEQLRSWVKDCPRPDQVMNSKWSSWRTIECGIRMANPWPRAFHRFLLSPNFTDDAMMDYIKCTIEHGEYLERYPSSTGNWLALETEGLYTIGVVFPELKQAKHWREMGVERMLSVLRDQLLPDGWQYEIATGYSQMTVELTLNVYRRAQEFGYLDEVPADYFKAMEKSYNMTLYFSTPDRMQPGVNDSGLGNARNYLRAVTDLFPDRKDFLWLATDGAQGTPPDHTSHAFTHAGYYVMRSGWGRQANYLMMDVGTLGMAHVHQDKLNIVMWVWGRRMLFDASGYTYDESKWRRYGISSYSHSTVIVDGLGQARDSQLHRKLVLQGPVDARWETADAYDFSAGYFDEGYGKKDNNIAKHTRRVLFVKPDLFVVSDTLESRDGQPHEYQARWQMISPKNTMDEATKTVRTIDEGQPNLAIVPLLTDGLNVRAVTMQTEGDAPQIMGFSYKGLTPVPATTVLHERKGPGVQQMLTLLAPLRVGDGEVVKSVRATGPMAAEVTFADGRRLIVEADADPAGGIQAKEIRADGSAGREVTGGKK